MNDDPAHSFEEIERRCANWVAARQDIRAAMVVGSRARTDRPADRWSDLDIVLLVRNPGRYLSESRWVADIGPVVLTFVEETATAGGRERRVLYQGGLDVDYAMFPDWRFRVLLLATRFRRWLPLLGPFGANLLRTQSEVETVLRRGFRILLDRDGTLAGLGALIPSEHPPTPARRPSQDQFLEVVNDFWYHALWAAKKLARGELWVACSASDGYMKSLLLQMLRWHTVFRLEGRGDTWHGERFVEEWADRDTLEDLRHAFAHYDALDIEHALLATMALFRRIAQETAAAWGYPYPSAADEQATALVKEVLAARQPR